MLAIARALARDLKLLLLTSPTRASPRSSCTRSKRPCTKSGAGHHHHHRRAERHRGAPSLRSGGDPRYRRSRIRGQRSRCARERRSLLRISCNLTSSDEVTRKRIATSSRCTRAIRVSPVPSSTAATSARSPTPMRSGARRRSVLTGSAPPTSVKNASFQAPGKVSIKWFEDGALNVSYNCIDRHLADARRQDRDHLGGRRPDDRQQDHLSRAVTQRSASSPTC